MPRAKQINLRLIGIGGIVLFALSCGGFRLNSLIQNSPVATATDLVRDTPTLKPPTSTSIPFTSTSLPPTTTFTPAPTFEIGSITISEKDGMALVYVPAGEFIMGSDSGSDNEKPAHQVNLDAFWMDQTEVTNAMYANCVADGACQVPTITSSYSHASYYGNSEFNDYPVLYADWMMSTTYCSWADRRLPTEAEWEKAARGTHGNMYPWGNTDPKDNLLNYNGNIGDTTESGSYPAGASIYDVYDMSGNVWEWVNDWYGETYYQGSPSLNPLGPDSGAYRVLRGGSWGYYDNSVRSAHRFRGTPGFTRDLIGFRCARSP